MSWTDRSCETAAGGTPTDNDEPVTPVPTAVAQQTRLHPGPRAGEEPVSHRIDHRASALTGMYQRSAVRTSFSRGRGLSCSLRKAEIVASRVGDLHHRAEQDGAFEHELRMPISIELLDQIENWLCSGQSQSLRWPTPYSAVSLIPKIRITDWFAASAATHWSGPGYTGVRQTPSWLNATKRCPFPVAHFACGTSTGTLIRHARWASRAGSDFLPYEPHFRSQPHQFGDVDVWRCTVFIGDATPSSNKDEQIRPYPIAECTAVYASKAAPSPAID